jgi:hypothetical protein
MAISPHKLLESGVQGLPKISVFYKSVITRLYLQIKSEDGIHYFQ